MAALKFCSVTAAAMEPSVILTTVTRKTTTTTTTTTTAATDDCTDRVTASEEEEQAEAAAAAAAAAPEPSSSSPTTHPQPLLRLANSPASRHHAQQKDLKSDARFSSPTNDHRGPAISSHLSSIDRYIAKLVKLADSVVDLEALPQFRRMPEVESLRALSASARTRTGIFDPRLEHQEAKIDVRLVNIKPLEEAKDLVDSILESAVGAAAEKEAGIEVQPQRTLAIQQAVDHHQQQLEAELQRQLQPIDNAATALATTGSSTGKDVDSSPDASTAAVASQPGSVALARSDNVDGIKLDEPSATPTSGPEKLKKSVDEGLADCASANQEPSTAQLVLNTSAAESAVVTKFQELDADGSGYLKGPELHSLAAWVRGTFGNYSPASTELEQRLVLRAEDKDPENGCVLQFAEFKEWWHQAQQIFHRPQQDLAGAREFQRAEHVPGESLHDEIETTAGFVRSVDMPSSSVVPVVAAQTYQAEVEAQTETAGASTPLQGEHPTLLDTSGSNGNDSRHRVLSSFSEASEDLLMVEPLLLNALDLGQPGNATLPSARPASGLFRVEPRHVVAMPPEDALEDSSCADEGDDLHPPLSSSEMDAAIDHELWVTDSSQRSKAEALEEEANLLSLDVQADLHRSARLVQTLHNDSSFPTQMSSAAIEAGADMVDESNSFSGDDSTGSIGEFIDAAYQEHPTGKEE